MKNNYIKKLNYIVTIDGPSSSGKSTLAKLLAKKLSISHIDSGSIYRAVTLYALENDFLSNQKLMLEKLVKSLSNSDMSLKENSNGIFKMYINSEDVEDKIRGSRVSKHVSEVAKYEEISFTKAYTNNPICGPSRSSFLSGVYPHNSLNFWQKPWYNNDVLVNTKTIIEK